MKTLCVEHLQSLLESYSHIVQKWKQRLKHGKERGLKVSATRVPPPPWFKSCSVLSTDVKLGPFYQFASFQRLLLTFGQGWLAASL